MPAAIVKKVIVFTTPTCSYCTLAKRYLRERKIRYREIDISKNEAAANDIKRRTGQTGVPVILINNHPVIGFDKNKINKLLDLK